MHACKCVSVCRGGGWLGWDGGCFWVFCGRGVFMSRRIVGCCLFLEDQNAKNPIRGPF